MIQRTLQKQVMEATARYPVVTVTGPRQSGKTTLAKMTFPDRPYVSLETPSEREFAGDDPLGFLARYPEGAILDEIQRAPELLSYLQGIVDEDPTPGRFVLTGSQNLTLMEGVSQSLAGRTALLELLPLELAEMRRFDDGATHSLDTFLWRGGYPRIHDRGLPAAQWLADYTATYLERDVRSLLAVGDMGAFHTFLRMCAGRVGQLLNLSSLAADCGVSQPTARHWLSTLEASFIVFRLQPFHANLGKRLTKRPKLYFHDSGLAANLLGIEEPEQLATHPLRGAMFDGWVVSEIVKWHRHRGLRPEISFYRERDRLEVDLVIENGMDLTLVEAKAGRTPASDYFAALTALAEQIEARGDGRWKATHRLVVYGGEESQSRSQGELVSWADLPERLAALQ
ncbi:MAG TPA: ATP-binding protein [Solirubrobacterales bacterium]|nr:ATP-binding protein [Solirubrobacterales bacterium]